MANIYAMENQRSEEAVLTYPINLHSIHNP